LACLIERLAQPSSEEVDSHLRLQEILQHIGSTTECPDPTPASTPPYQNDVYDANRLSVAASSIPSSLQNDRNSTASLESSPSFVERSGHLTQFMLEFQKEQADIQPFLERKYPEWSTNNSHFWGHTHLP
jgi:hypothetical protein